jgi:D-alanine-D-alanine ligase-like ATP-grasp enzyme
VLAEEFIAGREFSMLIVGDSHYAEAQSGDAADVADDTDASLAHLHCYTAAERAFTASLPPEEQFLTFEQNYPTSHTQCHTWWARLDVQHNAEHARDQAALELLAKRAYASCRGRSYGRIDLRQNRTTGEFVCLEVNSLPGLSGELDSSVGAILSLTSPKPVPFARFLYAILFLAQQGTLAQEEDEDESTQ